MASKYTIGSDKGKKIAEEMKVGTSWTNPSDGSTWTKKSDGSVSVKTAAGNTHDNAYVSTSTPTTQKNTQTTYNAPVNNRANYVGVISGANTDKGYAENYDYGLAANYGMNAGMSIDDMNNWITGYMNKTADPAYSKWFDQNLLNEMVARRDAAVGMNSQQEELLETINYLQSEMARQREQSDAYNQQAMSMINQLQNTQPFQYNMATDELYQILSEAYREKGNLAAQDTLAEYAAMTGGIPSSAAIAAANQQRNLYNSQFNSIIPELEQAAYNRYRNNYTDTYNLMNNLFNLGQNSYGNFVNAMNAGTNLNQYLTELNNQNYWNNRNFNYDVEQDAIQNQLDYEKLIETNRHNLQTEANARQNAAISAQNLALKQQEKAKTEQEEAEIKAIYQEYIEALNAGTLDEFFLQYRGQAYEQGAMEYIESLYQNYITPKDELGI